MSSGYDKLSIISDCLLIKGQNVPSVEDDGSVEWNVCSAAYEHAVKHLIQEHDWKFGTSIATLERSGDSDDANYEDVYPKPNGCLSLIWVRADDAPTDWRIIGNQIHVNADATYTVTAKYVQRPGPEDWPPMFVSALNEWVFSAIESGVKKDQATADSHMKKAYGYLERAKSRTDQEEPKRAFFRGSLKNSRRLRRG